MLRRLHATQPDHFAFTPANQAWAEAQVTKYPEGRQASAIIPLLWRAQEQEGWLTRPAIEHVSDMLGLAYIRGLEVASFYFMFQLQPVGSVAHIQVCGTTSCMICGAEDLVAVCKEKIAPKPHQISDDGKFSWEEVECLGACANAPMAQIGKDYYEDLTTARMGEIIDEMAAGKVPMPGPQNGRYTSEPLGGLTALKDHEANRHPHNASVQLAADIGDTIKRIDGTEVPLTHPWTAKAPTISKPAAKKAKAEKRHIPVAPKKAEAMKKGRPPASGPLGKALEAKATGTDPKAVKEDKIKTPAPTASAQKPVAADGKPELLTKARDGGADDLKQIKGVGPKMEGMLHNLGVFHFDQVASWRAEEVQWVDENLEGFKGRISRDDWVAQAKTLAQGGATEFSSRVQKGGVYNKK